MTDLKKISELSTQAVPADDVLIVIVDDPSGTPTTKRTTRGELLSGGTSPKFKRTSVNNTDYTILTTDTIVGYAAMSAPRTATLPAAADAGAGKVYILKDEGGNAGTHTLTLDGNGAETIDGAADQDITSNYGVIRVYTDGSNWFTF